MKTVERILCVGIILAVTLLCGSCAFAQSSGPTAPPPPYCSSANARALYTNTGTSPATVYTCSYYNLARQWVVNPSYGGLVYYPTVPATCSGALPVFLAGWPNTQEYVCVNGVPDPIGGSGSGVGTFSAPSVSWPSWLVPTVTNPTTIPSLAVAAGIVPPANGGTGATTAAGALANLGGLPLSGGTLTGALTGTSASFSGNVSAGTTVLNQNIANAVEYVSTTGSDSNDGLAFGSAKLTPAAALAALPSCTVSSVVYNHCGTIQIGGGVFSVSSSITVTSPYVWIYGQGNNVTILSATSGLAGELVNWSASTLNTGLGFTMAGGIYNLTLDGTNATAGVDGLLTENLIGFSSDGISIRNFSGSGSVCWEDTATSGKFNERYRVKMELANCPTLLGFVGNGSVTTFGYADYELWLNPMTNGIAISATNHAYIQYSQMHLIINANGTTGATGISVDGTSDFDSNGYVIHMEGEAVPFSVAAGGVFSGQGPVDTGAVGIAVSGTYGVFNAAQGRSFAASGTAAAPGYTFQEAPGTGMYVPSLGELGFTAGGSQIFQGDSGTAGVAAPAWCLTYPISGDCARHQTGGGWKFDNTVTVPSITATGTVTANSATIGGYSPLVNNQNTLQWVQVSSVASASGYFGIWHNSTYTSVPEIYFATNYGSGSFGIMGMYENSGVVQFESCTEQTGITPPALANPSGCAAALQMTQTICSGTISIPATAIASAAKSAFTATCTGAATTDNLMVDFAGGTDPTTLTGFLPSTGGILTVFKWATANTVNVTIENNTPASITPTAFTLNFRVTR